MADARTDPALLEYVAPELVGPDSCMGSVGVTTGTNAVALVEGPMLSNSDGYLPPLSEAPVENSSMLNVLVVQRAEGMAMLDLLLLALPK